MVSTSYFQRQHVGLYASPGLAARSRLRAAALPLRPPEPASAARLRGMVLANSPLYQTGVT